MKKKKKIVVSILILLAALMVFGCKREGSTRYSPNYETMALVRDFGGVVGFETLGSGYNDMSDGESMRRERALSTTSSGEMDTTAANLNNFERKLVKRANIRIRVENLESADIFIVTLMEEFNAYSASTSIAENQNVYSLRVPSTLYDAFLAEMSGMGRVMHRLETTEDVTLRYYDLEGRLESKKELLQTFQSYLRRASNINDILSVEARIADLQREIDSTGTQLRNLANMVDYATVDLYLFGHVANFQKKGDTFGERIKKLFGNYGNVLSSVVVVLIGFVIYGVPLLALLVLLFWLFFGKIGLARKLWHVIRK